MPVIKPFKWMSNYIDPQEFNYMKYNAKMFGVSISLISMISLYKWKKFIISSIFIHSININGGLLCARHCSTTRLMENKTKSLFLSNL